MKEIKNIIFDLGNVLLDLDWKRTENAFRQMLKANYDRALEKYRKEKLFERLEVGCISPAEFLQGMQRATHHTIHEKEILYSWNAILVEIPPARLQWLRELRTHYDLYLLSNTNAIHIDWVDQHLRQTASMTIDDFNALFVKPYYSFEIQLRKPDREIYEYVLNDANLRPEESLFIDDMEENIISARKLGLQTIHHRAGTEIMQAFFNERMKNEE